MPREPSKYFGLRSSTDLYLKLVYDIERLRTGRGTKELQYAAIDAAVTASHILDWVLKELEPEAYLRLTGLEKGKPLPPKDRGPIMRFIELKKETMPGINFCREIANTMKHMKLSLGSVMKGMAIGSTVKLQWTDNRITSTEAIAYVQIKPDGEKINVIDLFQQTAEQWREFLVDEGLWVEQPPDWDE